MYEFTHKLTKKLKFTILGNEEGLRWSQTWIQILQKIEQIND